MSEYQADPTLIDVPLHLAEIEALAADGGRALRDNRKLQHFLQRTASTVRMYKQQVQSLHRDVQEIKISKERAGAATTLSPVDAVKYLSEAQLEQLFGRVARQQLEYLRRQQIDAQNAQRDARAEISRIRFALVGMIEDPATPMALRERLAQLSRSMPGDPSVHGAAPTGAPAAAAPGPAPATASFAPSASAPAPAPREPAVSPETDHAAATSPWVIPPPAP